MKSRIIDLPAEKILIYGFSPEREALFAKVAEKLGTELKIIPEDMAAQTVGYLAGFAGASDSGERASAQGECVIFLTDGKKLNKTLEMMRAEGLGGIPLKAAVTEHNRRMTLIELMDELAREHRKLHPEENN